MNETLKFRMNSNFSSSSLVTRNHFKGSCLNEQIIGEGTN